MMSVAISVLSDLIAARRRTATALPQTGLTHAALEAMAAAMLVSMPARGETISDALARAYATSPDINAQRAGTRATDENVSKAVSGYRPTLSGNASASRLSSETNPSLYDQPRYTTPRNGNVTLTQTLYNGGRTGNSVSQADSQVLQAREQ